LKAHLESELKSDLLFISQWIDLQENLAANAIWESAGNDDSTLMGNEQ
jgi:hypothetical protein